MRCHLPGWCHCGEIEGRTKSEVARDYGVSRRWVQELCRRFAVEARPGSSREVRRPRASPRRTCVELEDEMVAAQRSSAISGSMPGGHTLGCVVRRHGEQADPSVATIWRILGWSRLRTPAPQSGRDSFSCPVRSRHAQRGRTPTAGGDGSKLDWPACVARREAGEPDPDEPPLSPPGRGRRVPRCVTRSRRVARGPRRHSAFVARRRIPSIARP